MLICEAAKSQELQCQLLARLANPANKRAHRYREGPSLVPEATTLCLLEGNPTPPVLSCHGMAEGACGGLVTHTANTS